MTYFHKTMESPIGRLTLIASPKGLAAILFPGETLNRTRFKESGEDKQNVDLKEAERQLTEYFLGKRRQFTLELDSSGTDFQMKVWKGLASIPYGETRSYGEIAKVIGQPKACRAVGAANGRNPIPIVVPCHRVIGSTGKLTGFGGGLAIKAKLLEIEGIEV